jgi:4-amino-4-deoxy-L-arabinose transferase-like glycosyltransferase
VTGRRGAWLLALVALAGGLRLYGLGSWSIDGDEYYSWYDCQALLRGGSEAAWPEGARAFPVGYLAMAVSVKLLGLSEFAVRLVSALAGSAAVLVLAGMRRDVFTPLVSGGAALLAALSPWLIYHAQTARFYAPLLLCSALALLWSLPGPGRRPRASLAAALVAVGCHPTALMLLPGLAVAALLSAPDVAAGWRGVGRGALVLGLLAGAALALPQFALEDVLEGALEPSGGAAYNARHFILGLAYNAGPLVGLAALIGAVRAW